MAEEEDLPRVDWESLRCCERWKDEDLEELSTSVMTQGVVRSEGREPRRQDIPQLSSRLLIAQGSKAEMAA